MMRKLGKHAAVPTPHLPRLRDLAQGRIALPAQVDNTSKVQAWGMLDNDRLGDCVIAMTLHWIMQRTALLGQPITFGNQDADSLYAKWAGWDGTAGDASDQGMVMADALTDWTQGGVPLPSSMALDKASVVASIEQMQLAWIRYAIWKAGAVGLGIQCPIAWVEDVKPGGVLDVPGYLDPRDIAGGHAVLLTGYQTLANGTFLFDTITWGDVYHTTGRGVRVVGDEAFAVLDQDWMNATTGFDPDGLNWQQALAVMGNLQHGVV